MRGFKFFTCLLRGLLLAHLWDAHFGLLARHIDMPFLRFVNASMDG
jgi:hypothetical protein